MTIHLFRTPHSSMLSPRRSLGLPIALLGVPVRRSLILVLVLARIDVLVVGFLDEGVEARCEEGAPKEQV